MKTTQWIWLVVLSIALGCSPNPPREPETESPPTYSQGDVVYHKLGGECIILREYEDQWKIRYIDGLGEYQCDYFYKTEFEIGREMIKFEGNKFIEVDDGDYFSAEYVEWLESQIESLRSSNVALRKRLEASHRDEARRLRYDHDYVEYPDDDR